jgi:phosphopantothenoylcysteine decarboxylase/phosphopantothenate--cysteine ligase
MTPFEKENLSAALRGRKILLGITGSIAAFKACDIIRYLRSCGAEVRVVLTHGAENFVTRTTLETLSGATVLTGFWDARPASLGAATYKTAAEDADIFNAPIFGTAASNIGTTGLVDRHKLTSGAGSESQENDNWRIDEQRGGVREKIEARSLADRSVLTPDSRSFPHQDTGLLDSVPQGARYGSLQGTHHIDTARWADLILIAPTTANYLAKIAYGMADDLLTTEILAFRGPLLIAPAMNPAMYTHPAVQENVARLKARGVTLLGPDSGLTSCGEEGPGRMIEPLQIVEQVSAQFHAPSNQKHLLITLGPTRSALDPVRYLSNRSSGFMGASLCWAALQAGYRVTAVSGPLAPGVTLPASIRIIPVQTAAEMARATLDTWPTAQVFIGTAAVLDWDIKNPATTKIKKEQGSPQLIFEKNIDILEALSQSRTRRLEAHRNAETNYPGQFSRQFILGFAAETDDPIPNGFAKLKKKGCDAIFVNDVSQPDAGFESSQNAGWWLSGSDRVVTLPKTSKIELARKLIALIPN